MGIERWLSTASTAGTTTELAGVTTGIMKSWSTSATAGSIGTTETGTTETGTTETGTTETSHWLWAMGQSVHGAAHSH